MPISSSWASRLACQSGYACFHRQLVVSLCAEGLLVVVVISLTGEYKSFWNLGR